MPVGIRCPTAWLCSSINPYLNICATALLNGLGLGHLLPTFEAEELGLPLLQKMAEDPTECAMVLDEVGVGMCNTSLPFDVHLSCGTVHPPIVK